VEDDSSSASDFQVRSIQEESDKEVPDEEINENKSEEEKKSISKSSEGLTSMNISVVSKSEEDMLSPPEEKELPTLKLETNLLSSSASPRPPQSRPSSTIER